MEGNDIMLAAQLAEVDPLIHQLFIGQGQIDAAIQQVVDELGGGTVQLTDADLRVGAGEGGQIVGQIAADIASQGQHELGCGVHTLNVLHPGAQLGKGNVYAGEKHAAVIVQFDLALAVVKEGYAELLFQPGDALAQVRL